MDESLNKQLHTDADMKNYEIEEQRNSNIINTLDNQPVNDISNDEEVCIYNLSTDQSFVNFDYILKIEAHI